MEKLNFRQAYDLIIDAYFKDEINPLDAKFCFCGSLCGKTDDWFGRARSFHNDSHGYKGIDFLKMEKALIHVMQNILGHILGNEDKPEYEEALFKGMSASLEVLREIHISRGEVIDEKIPFKKRELLKV